MSIELKHETSRGNRMNFLKRLIAGAELERLERYETILHACLDWTRNDEVVTEIIYYCQDVAEEREIPNRENPRIKEINSMILKRDTARLELDADSIKTKDQLTSSQEHIAKLEKELTKAYADLGHAKLAADAYTDRYNEANKSRKITEDQLLKANEDFQRSTVYSKQISELAKNWHSALYDCAQLLKVGVGKSICESPTYLQRLLSNLRFSFRKDIVAIDDDMKRTDLEEAITLMLLDKSRQFLMPGLPCKSCDDANCCALGKECVIIKMSTP